MAAVAIRARPGFSIREIAPKNKKPATVVAGSPKNWIQVSLLRVLREQPAAERSSRA
jgi:hypothetical protein